MAGTLADFKIYNDEFQAGMTEVLMQNSDAFNAASANALRIVPSLHRGNFAKEAFFEEVSSLITRRDVTSTSAGASSKLEQGEFIMPKLNRRYQVDQTRDAFKKILAGVNAWGEFSVRLGEQVAKAKMVDYLNTILASLSGAVDGNSDVQFNAVTGGVSGVTNLSYKNLIKGLSKFGDASQDISAWVMHSAPFHDLLGESVGIATDRVAGATIYEGTAGTLGRPVIVTDSPSLILSGSGSGSGGAVYRTFGLTTNAGVILESESAEDIPVFDTVTGLENVVYRIQGEHAYNVRAKGYSYTDSGANPTDANLIDDTNWAQASSDKKSTAGVVIYSN
jgi:hypothetical protein